MESTPLTAAERAHHRKVLNARGWLEAAIVDRLLAEHTALAAQLAEAVGIAWQLREACRAVLRDAYNEDWPEVAAAAAAFDALNWPDPKEE